MGYVKTPTTREGRQQVLKIIGSPLSNSNRYLDSEGEFNSLVNDPTSDRFYTHGIGRTIGQVLNAYNSPTATSGNKTAALDELRRVASGEDIKNRAKTLKQLEEAGYLDEGEAGKFNSVLETLNQYVPETVKGIQALGGVKATVSGGDFVSQVTGEKNVFGDRLQSTTPPSKATTTNSKALIDQILATPKQQTTNLQQYDWWNKNDLPTREATFAEVQKITSSAQGMANYVLSKGLTDLENFDWWKESPFKNEAWKIIQSKMPQQSQGNQQVNPIDQINEEANALQQQEFDAITSQTSKVDLSTSGTLVEKLIEAFNTNSNAPQTSLVAEMEKKRSELGVGALEDNLAALDADIKQLDADYSSTVPEEDNRRTSLRQINQRQSEISLQYNRQRRDLIAERDAVAGELNTKYGVINSFMNVLGQDIDNARQSYNDKFNQALQMINLVKGIENDEASAAEKRSDNARANLQVMTNLLKDGNVDYDKLDAATMLDIRRMEIEAGLPSGFTSFIHEAVKDPVVTFGTAFTDEGGTRIQPIFTKNADGTIQIQNVELGEVGGENGKVSEFTSDAPVATGGKFKNRLTGTGTITAYGSSAWKPGLDLAAPKDSPIFSPGKATVRKIVSDYSTVGANNEAGKKQNGGFGNQVVLELADGNLMFISHLNAVNPELFVGQEIPVGEVVGNMGNTGFTMGKTGVHADITMKPNDGKYSLSGSDKTLWTAKQVAEYIAGDLKTSRVPVGDLPLPKGFKSTLEGAIENRNPSNLGSTVVAVEPIDEAFVDSLKGYIYNKLKLEDEEDVLAAIKKTLNSAKQTNAISPAIEVTDELVESIYQKIQ